MIALFRRIQAALDGDHTDPQALADLDEDIAGAIDAVEQERAIVARVIPMLVQLGDYIGNGPIDPSRPGSLGTRCDLIGDLQALLARA